MRNSLSDNNSFVLYKQIRNPKVNIRRVCFYIYFIYQIITKNQTFLLISEETSCYLLNMFLCYFLFFKVGVENCPIIEHFHLNKNFLFILPYI